MVTINTNSEVGCPVSMAHRGAGRIQRQGHKVQGAEWVCSCAERSGPAREHGNAPARMMEVTTGVSSRESARPSTPPTERVRPSLANSRTNCGRVLQGFQGFGDIGKTPGSWQL